MKWLGAGLGFEPNLSDSGVTSPVVLHLEYVLESLRESARNAGTPDAVGPSGSREFSPLSGSQVVLRLQVGDPC